MKAFVFSTFLFVFCTALQAFDFASTKKLAEQGDAEAQKFVGDLYMNGTGVPQDYKEAIKWYRKSAEQGNASAQVGLGTMYYTGQGVPQDYKEAVKWHRKSAEQGNASAQFTLGLMYYKGHGVIEDFIASYAWLNNAKANGSIAASTFILDLKESMTKEQIAIGQTLAKKLFQEVKNRVEDSPVHIKYD